MMTFMQEDAGPGASPDLFAELYPELRQLAHSRLRKNEPITLLDTTSLVHEAYLRVMRAGKQALTDRSHFRAYVAHVMRSIVVDLVRQRRAERRGGDQERVTLDTGALNPNRPEEDQIIRVSDALDELAAVDERLVKVVEMRYFGGMSELEIAEGLGVTERTVRRDWEKARILLASALK
jgi:RNA polymerase sigma factor (TIGR02999 family)